ncbi:transmembrane protein 26-like [Mizuhopecten yessoensis]|uniref:Transmembrane protein 26 n=1 Tax=Mizuhopecten yessoensis TaxID=6573 RepID=A0A210R5U5_MIZYE|nr:transmembrane protein 26-like [Mizuhopecten yessoensis]OWF56274.1 Transmembrane protein 26 [Mizuhopecten yessoensis]
MKVALACFDILKAILVRLVLVIHSLLAVWRVVSINDDNFFWWFAIVDVVLVLEGVVAVIVRKGMEYKWFCPCFLLYLGGTVPAIWLLELDRRERFINTLHPVAVTNATNLTAITTSSSVLSSVSVQEEIQDNIISVYGVTIPLTIELEPDTWVVIIEQLLLYFMILGRWILPRGKISRNELSQLLFVFIGMASDITELFALFDESQVRQSLELTYVILIMWSVSLIQFCFVLTATKNPSRPRVALASPREMRRKLHCSTCYSTELWSIFVLMLMQDLPFLVIRTYTIASLNLITYSIIFFTAKNILIVLLLIYRVAVICCVKKDDEDDNEPTSPKAEEMVYRKGKTNGHLESISVIEHKENYHRHPKMPSLNNLQNNRIHCPTRQPPMWNEYQTKGIKLNSHLSTLAIRKHHIAKQYIHHNRASLGSL